MKKIIIVLVLTMLSVFAFAEAPIDGGYVGYDMVGLTANDEPVSGLLLQLAPTDMCIDVYFGVGLTENYLKGGVVFTPWELAPIPIGAYLGIGANVSPVTDGELVKSFAGFETTAIIEAGLVCVFTRYSQIRVGYTNYNNDSAINIGMVVGYNSSGFGVFDEDN